MIVRTGARVSLNMVSVINARGQMRFMVHEGRLTAEVFVEFLKRLVRGTTLPVFLVLDGHSAHCARLVREYVATCDGRLRLFFLPPSAPQVNPDEQVWNPVKHHGVGRAFVRTKAELKACVQAGLRRIQRSPWLIRMFFLLPDTRYAAL